MTDLIDWMVERIMLVFVSVCFLLVFIGLPWFLYAWYTSSKSPTFELRKDQWTCSRSHVETSTYYIKSGSVMVPQISHNAECDEWTRK